MPYHYVSFSLTFPPFDMSFNSSFIDSSSLNTTSQLYSSLNLDYTQLNWFERHWMAWYLWIGNPLLATGIASFILHEVCVPLPALQRTAPSSSYADCLFRSLFTMDHHRRDPIFPQVEIATGKGPYTAGAVGVYQGRPLLPLHG